MLKNNSNEIAREFLKTGKEIFGNRMEGISLYNVTEEPFSMFSIKF